MRLLWKTYLTFCGTTVDLNLVFFVNNDIGWVVGLGGVIIKSTDSDWKLVKD